MPNRTQVTPIQEERKNVDQSRVRDEKLSALKAYRKSKGLCFTCEERWSKEHKCANSVQLHVVQELLEVIHPGQESSPEDDTSSVEGEGNLLAISQ